MSLPYIARDAEHRQIEFDGSLLSVLVGADVTDGRVSVFRARVPGGFAPPVHLHSREDEIFVLLEGSGIYWCGDKKYEPSAGGVALLPRNLPHAFRITSPSADVVVICVPGGLERYFRAIGWDPSRPKPDGWAPASPEIMDAAAVESGQRILGPPLAGHSLMPAAYLDSGV